MQASLLVGGVSLLACLIGGAYWSIKRLLARPRSWGGWSILGGCLAYPVGVAGVFAHLWNADQMAAVLADLIIAMLVISILLTAARPDVSIDSSAVTIFAAGQILSLLLIAIFRLSAVLGLLVVLLIGGWVAIWLPETRRRVSSRVDSYVNCLPDAVFRNVADPARMPLLSPSARVELPPEGSVGPGYRYRYWMGPKLLPRIEATVQVSEYRPPELIEEVHHVGDTEYLVSWTLVLEGSGTRAQFRQERTLTVGDALLGGALISALIPLSLRDRFRRLNALCTADESVGKSPDPNSAR